MTHREAWQFMLTSRNPVSAKMIADATGMATESAKAFIRKLQAQGRLQRVWVGRDSLTHTYRVIDRSPLPAANRKLKRPPAAQRIWNSCRMLRTFSADEVVATAQVAESTVMRFIRGMQKANLLKTMADPDLGQLYRVAFDLGSKPPVIQADGVYVPSRDKLYGFKERP